MLPWSGITQVRSSLVENRGHILMRQVPSLLDIDDVHIIAAASRKQSGVRRIDAVAGTGRIDVALRGGEIISHRSGVDLRSFGNGLRVSDFDDIQRVQLIDEL